MPASSGKSIMVFTSKDTETILKLGGSQSWRLRIEYARTAEYIFCARRIPHAPTSLDDMKLHRAGFLVGRISDIVPAIGYPGARRWLVEFDEYAEIEIPNAWPKKNRYPVRYNPTEVFAGELEIDLDELGFKKSPPRDEDFCRNYVDPGYKGNEVKTVSSSASTNDARPGLSIPEAKEELAAFYSVPAENIEVTIKG